ncbi:PP2C family protein-serine/threonine phosphatase [Melittangium boletus]|uniref:PP2C family protein-serine/threonine phosphatase n=1 Tax=Melittangium boletus TaxID=83453 RepID=UPI003DA5102E
MPAWSRIDSGAATHIGRRSNNEDAFCQKPEVGFFAVADGLGGHEGGEVASHLVLRTVVEFLSTDEHTAPSAPALLTPHPEAEPLPEEGATERMLREAVRLAHHEVRAQQKGKLHMMASTLTSLLFVEDEVVVCNLGDSRSFLVRDGEVRRLTKDHTVLAEMEAAGLDIKTPFALRHRNSLTGAVGMEESVEPECGRVAVRPGDVLLLCSDGLYEPVPPALMLEVLAEGGSAQESIERLVTRAYDRGGTDNITGIVLRLL